jgi:hypothetical protein
METSSQGDTRQSWTSKTLVLEESLHPHTRYRCVVGPKSRRQRYRMWTRDDQHTTHGPEHDREERSRFGHDSHCRSSKQDGLVCRQSGGLSAKTGKIRRGRQNKERHRRDRNKIPPQKHLDVRHLETLFDCDHRITNVVLSQPRDRPTSTRSRNARSIPRKSTGESPTGRDQDPRTGGVPETTQIHQQSQWNQPNTMEGDLRPRGWHGSSIKRKDNTNMDR